jgi:uncharacterized Zn finger protein (UPF0148 family)
MKTEDSLRIYIRHMLVYWDPWNLIHGSGAPENEYDSYIERIATVLEKENLNYDNVLNNLNTVFSDRQMPQENLHRALCGMAEGIIFFSLLQKNNKYTCPVCGYKVFSEKTGSYEICPICNWEDDLSQLAFPEMSGGANTVSLIEAQENFEKKGYSDELFKEHTRKPLLQDIRDSNWRKFDKKRDASEHLIDETGKYVGNLIYWFDESV